MEKLLDHMLRNMNLTIGYGKNYFTMNRGSFYYRKMVRWRRDLKRTGYTKTEDGSASNDAGFLSCFIRTAL